MPHAPTANALTPVARRWLDALPAEERAAAEAHARYGAFHHRLIGDMRILLRSKGISQRELAKRMGTTESAISRLLDEDGARGVQAETIVRFAEALGVDLAPSWFASERLVAPAPVESSRWSVAAASQAATTWSPRPQISASNPLSGGVDAPLARAA